MTVQLNPMTCNARWVRQQWWGNEYLLKSDEGVIASVHVRGSRGIAEIRHCEYTLRRFRLPPFITLRDAADELIARFELLPRNGLLAEFHDGESYRLGWVRSWKREWNWTDSNGAPVLCSRYRLFGPPEIVVPIKSGCCPSAKWPQLAVLQLSMGELAVPWSRWIVFIHKSAVMGKHRPGRFAGLVSRSAVLRPLSETAPLPVGRQYVPKPCPLLLPYGVI